jgi:hypothetical protein
VGPPQKEIIVSASEGRGVKICWKDVDQLLQSYSKRIVNESMVFRIDETVTLRKEIARRRTAAEKPFKKNSQRKDVLNR